MEIDLKNQMKPINQRLERRREKEKMIRMLERQRELIRNREIEARLQAKIQAKKDLQDAKERRIQDVREQKLIKSLLKLQKRDKLLKPEKPPSKALLRELARREREKIKKWREKDKKALFERIKERYL
jgi:hypothetical protein